MSGWYVSPSHFYQAPPLALLQQSKGLCTLRVKHRLTPRLSLFFALQTSSSCTSLTPCFFLSAIELSAKDYACHSFRRGGASFAVHSGVPVKHIKLLGAWPRMLCYFTLWSLFLLDCTLLIPSISPFSLQTIFSQPPQFGFWSVTNLLPDSF